MALVNDSKPVTVLANTSKVSIGETWATITTTWATETRTWLAVSQLLTNISSPMYKFLLRENGGFILLENNGYIKISDTTSITNQSKP